jgi:hypothetical protein
MLSKIMHVEPRIMQQDTSFYLNYLQEGSGKLTSLERFGRLLDVSPRLDWCFCFSIMKGPYYQTVYFALFLC